MTKARFLFLLLTGAGLAACEPTLVGSSSVVTFEHPVTEIDRLQLFHEITATVIRGDERRVRITINENLRDHLELRQEGARLVVGMEDGFDYHHLTADVEVTLPALAAMELAGASQARLAGFEAVSVAHLAAALSGASRLEGAVAADRLDLVLSGASRTDLGGVARELRLELSGASAAGLGGLSSQVATVELSGASRAVLRVQDEVRGEASGASELVVQGGALTHVETSGASSVSQRE